MKQHIKVSDNFWLWEFFDKETYEDDRLSVVSLIGILDPKIINLSQFIRERYGLPVTINDWKSGGTYSFSGFRPPNCMTGAQFSQHRFGRACDYKIDGMSSFEFREDIREHFILFKNKGLSTIEKGTTTWTHCDVRETQQNELYEVSLF